MKCEEKMNVLEIDLIAWTPLSKSQAHQNFFLHSSFTTFRLPLFVSTRQYIYEPFLYMRSHPLALVKVDVRDKHLNMIIGNTWRL